MFTTTKFKCGNALTDVPNTFDPACPACGSLSHPQVEVVKYKVTRTQTVTVDVAIDIEDSEQMVVAIETATVVFNDPNASKAWDEWEVEQA